MLKWIIVAFSSFVSMTPIAQGGNFYCSGVWRFDAGNIQHVKHVDTVDGDTFAIDITGLPDLFGKRILVRVRGIDAGELKADDTCERKMGLAAQVRLHALLSNAQRIDLYRAERDKYFRILADVKINGAVDIGLLFAENGWAVNYVGRTKKQHDWCKLLKQLK